MIMKYTTNPFNNTNVCPPGAPKTTTLPCNKNTGGNKRDPNTPKEAKAAASQCPKKACRAVPGNVPKRSVTDMGMFHLP